MRIFKPLSSLYVWSIFILLWLLKDSLSGYGTVHWQFSFFLWKICLFSSVFIGEMSVINHLSFFYKNPSFLSGNFFHLIFCNFTITYLGMGLFMFLGTHSFQSEGSSFFNSGIFSALIFLNITSLPNLEFLLFGWFWFLFSKLLYKYVGTFQSIIQLLFHLLLLLISLCFILLNSSVLSPE